MEKPVVGMRVGALVSIFEEQKMCTFLGYGIYTGDEVPDEKCGSFGPYLRELSKTNPKIVLDSGKIVWGCECWWGDENKIKRLLNGYRLVAADIDRVRRVNIAKISPPPSKEYQSSQRL